MLDGATKAYIQGYNAEIAVDCDSQIILGADVTQNTNDKKELVPLIEQIAENTGQMPKAALADSGFFSESNVSYAENNNIDPFIPKDRIKHSDVELFLPDVTLPSDAGVVDRMLEKLKTKEARQIYSKRKQTVEPVFGQIKDARGIRSFLLRGLEQVKGEWKLICLTHNILKLWRSLCRSNRTGAPFFAKKQGYGFQVKQFLFKFVEFASFMPQCYVSCHLVASFRQCGY